MKNYLTLDQLLILVLLQSNSNHGNEYTNRGTLIRYASEPEINDLIVKSLAYLSIRPNGGFIKITIKGSQMLIHCLNQTLTEVPDKSNPNEQS